MGVDTATDVTPTSNAVIGINGNVTTAATSSLIIKATPGNLYSVYATNLTATAGFLIIVNSASVPSTGAITGVLDCVVLPANGTASINYGAGPPRVYSNGIVALVSSGADAWTYTSGVITAFISGSAP